MKKGVTTRGLLALDEPMDGESDGNPPGARVYQPWLS